MKVNILVLAAGHPDQERDEHDYPLCLTEFDGTSLLEKLVDNTRGIKDAQYTFALREEEVERYHLDRVVELIASGARIVRVPKITRGSACTALLAASQFNPQQELLVVSANELVNIDFNAVIAEFRARSLDGGTLTFYSVHPRYSFVRLDESGFVVETTQRNPISHHATAGVFWFARSGDFVEAVKNMIRKDACVDGQFYIAPAFNEIVLRQGRVGVQQMDPHSYHPLKTEKQISKFEQTRDHENIST